MQCPDYYENNKLITLFVVCSSEIDFIYDLKISNPNNLNELEEALMLISSIECIDDIDQIGALRDALAFVDLFIRTETQIDDWQLRKIVQMARK